MNDYAYVGGKPLAQFLTETSRTAVAKLNRPDLFEDVYQELWVFALSRPDLTDRQTIRNHHQTNAIFDPWYRVDDPEVNYSAAKVLKLEGQRIAQQMMGEGIERPTEDRYTSKDVGKLLKDWGSLPVAVRLALESDRMPEQYRAALERRYRDGEPAKVVGEKNLQRARDRLVEILNSGGSSGQDAAPEVVSQEGWGPQLREANFKAAKYTEEASESDSEPLGYGGTSEPSTSLYGALSGTYGGICADSTDNEILAYVCAPSGMRKRPAVEQRAWLSKYFDIEPDLFIWGVTGRISDPTLAYLIDQMTPGMRHALWTRYSPEAEPKDKRNHHDEALIVLRVLREVMGVGEGRGMAKK